MAQDTAVIRSGLPAIVRDAPAIRPGFEAIGLQVAEIQASSSAFHGRLQASSDQTIETISRMEQGLSNIHRERGVQAEELLRVERSVTTLVENKTKHLEAMLQGIAALVQREEHVSLRLIRPPVRWVCINY